MNCPRHEDEQVTLVINATAEGALERLQQQPIDLIIADVRPARHERNRTPATGAGPESAHPRHHRQLGPCDRDGH
jgi:hypothetical protein